MYKVLLVDDEPAALEALRLAADWEDLGYVICGECSNGEEAVGLVESLRPDLVVTDVRMPVMDGLDLVRHVLEHIPSDAEFVLVSGYDEFEYAKRAIKYGIRHYVLKPVIKEEFSAVLAEIADRFVKRDRLKELDAWNRDVEAYAHFERLISGVREELTTGAGESAPGGVGLTDAGQGAFWAYAIIKPCVNRASVHELPDRVHLNCSELKSELEASENREYPANPYAIAHIAPLDKGGYGLVLRCSRPDCSANAGVIPEDYTEALPQSTAGSILKNAAEALRTELTRIFRSGFYLAVSSSADSPMYLEKLAGEAAAALNFRFFKPAGSILLYEEYSLCKLNYSLDCIEGRDDIYESLENLDRARLDASVGKVFEAFAGTFTSPEVVEIYLTNVIYKGLELVKGMGGDIAEMVKNYPGGMLNFSGLSLDEARSIFESYLRDVLEVMNRLKSTEKQSDMLKVKNYVSDHYKSGITIREISGHVYINPVYLGHLFRKWFGCGFNEYVNRLRIEEAKRLLAETDRKVGDIAKEVGYGEYGTFLKQFEKYAGMKPAEYRDSCK